MPTGRLLQRWPGAVLSDSDRIWCMYAFVTLVYGLLLPLLLLYVKEVHFRGKCADLFGLRRRAPAQLARAVMMNQGLCPMEWQVSYLQAPS